jgi:hypothetical protein
MEWRESARTTHVMSSPHKPLQYYFTASGPGALRCVWLAHIATGRDVVTVTVAVCADLACAGGIFVVVFRWLSLAGLGCVGCLRCRKPVHFVLVGIVEKQCSELRKDILVHRCVVMGKFPVLHEIVVLAWHSEERSVDCGD